MGVSVLAELTNDLWIIELVGSKELLRVLMGVDLDLGHGVVDGSDLNVLRNSVLEPALENGDFASLLEFIDQFLHGHSRPHDLEDLLDVALLALEVDERSKDDGDGLRVLVDLEQVNLDVLGEVVLVEVADELIVLLSRRQRS